MFDYDCRGNPSLVWIAFALLVSDMLAETAAQNTAMFMVSRVIIGVGITPGIVGASSLISGRSIARRACQPTDVIQS